MKSTRAIARWTSSGCVATTLLLCLLSTAPATAQPYTFTHLAGLLGRIGPGSSDGIGSAARFNGPAGVAFDASSGTLFVADTGNYTIRRMSPEGRVTTLAGRPGIYGFADGAGNAARFKQPRGVAVDGSGNAYVADEHTIRKVSLAGVVTTLAGLGGVSGSADGTGSAARFRYPCCVAVDGSGNVYVADTGNTTIRLVAPDGAVSTIAGLAGASGSADGTGTTARFGGLTGLTIGPSGDLYVIDPYNSIRRITPAGVVTTVPTGLLDTGAGVLIHPFWAASGISVDGLGNLYVANSSYHIILKVTPAGVVTILAGLPPRSTSYDQQEAGSVDGTGTAAHFSGPTGVAADAAGNVFVADTGNHTIRHVTPAAQVTTVAGLSPHGSNDGPGGEARLYAPQGVAVGRSGLYVADTSNHTIRKVSFSGAVTTLAGLAETSGTADGTGSAARFNSPKGLAVDTSENVYVADYGNHAIRKISPDGVVTTLAGLGGVFGHVNGTGSAARFRYPNGVVVDSHGNAFVSDGGYPPRWGNISPEPFPQEDGHMIRKITPEGVVTTLAGVAGNFNAVDGTGSAAHFYFPDGIAIDGSGNLYVTDYGYDGILPSSLGNRIRKITPEGVVTTLLGGAPYEFNAPAGIASDRSGNLYVADTWNRTIKKVTTQGVVSILAGQGLFSPQDAADGTGSAAHFSYPAGIAVDDAGDVYVADAFNDAIRKGHVATSLLLLPPERVKVTVDWRSQYSGQSGAAVSIPQSDVSGFFYFSDLGNPEVFVKVLDFGDGKARCFVGGLTDFYYKVTFTMMSTGQTLVFEKPAGAYVGFADGGTLKFERSGPGARAVIEGAAVLAGSLPFAPDHSTPARQPSRVSARVPAPMVAAQSLTLSQDRVQVMVDWRNPYSAQGGTAFASPQQDAFGFFYFTDPDNPEVFVKVLDFGQGGALCFVGGLTDFYYKVTFTTLRTGQTLVFEKPVGLYVGFADNGALRF